MIDFLVYLRNSCAHTTLINRFRTPKVCQINTLLISSFSLTPKNTTSVLKLYDTMKILSFFTDVSALKKPLKKLRVKMFISLGIKKGNTTYNKILARMGCENYNEWRKILSNPTYSL